MRLVPGLLSVVLALVLAGCSSSSETVGGGGDDSVGRASGTVIEIGDDSAIRWGDGEYGVVLAHGAAFDAASWEQQAVAIAEQGATVVAVESIAPDAVAAAVEVLRSDGHPDVALVGGSAGADAILRLVGEQPDLPDRLVLLSPNTVVGGLGEQPKLFIASEDEPVADVATELAAAGPGDDNRALLLPGSAHAQNIFDGPQSARATQALLEALAR